MCEKNTDPKGENDKVFGSDKGIYKANDTRHFYEIFDTFSDIVKREKCSMSSEGDYCYQSCPTDSQFAPTNYSAESLPTPIHVPGTTSTPSYFVLPGLALPQASPNPTLTISDYFSSNFDVGNVHTSTEPQLKKLPGIETVVGNYSYPKNNISSNFQNYSSSGSRNVQTMEIPQFTQKSYSEVFESDSTSNMGIDSRNMDMMDTNSQVKSSSIGSTGVEKSQSPELSYSTEVSTSSRKSCHNCGKPRGCTGRLHPETGVRLCRNCYLFWERHGMDKPSSLFKSCSKRSARIPKEQKRIIVKCTHCKSSSSQTTKRYHPITRKILCRACRDYYRIHGEDRPSNLFAPRQEMLEIPPKSNTLNANVPKRSCKLCNATDPHHQKYLHPITQQLICWACYVHYHTFGEERLKGMRC